MASLLLVLAGCHHPVPAPAGPVTAPPAGPVTATVTGQAMGGMLRIVVRCPSRDLHAECLDAALKARSEIDRIEALATDWHAPGDAWRLNDHAGQGPVAISDEVHVMLATAQRVGEATGGAFDVSIGTLWGLWDFDAHKKADPAELARRLPHVGLDKVVLGDGTAEITDPVTRVTLGGIAQGYAAQRALALIPAKWEAMVDISGDIAVRGTWPVGIQHPRRPRGTVMGTVTVTDAVLVTSGDYERYFIEDGVRYHHILDPKTGMPARGAMSATVVAGDGAVADALATALMVTGPDAAAVRELGAWALVVTDQGTTELGDRDDRVGGWSPISPPGP